MKHLVAFGAGIAVLVGGYVVSRLLVGPLMSLLPVESSTDLAIAGIVLQLVIWGVLVWIGLRVLKKRLQSPK